MKRIFNFNQNFLLFLLEESNLLLRGHRKHETSKSDISTNLCEIDDSEQDDDENDNNISESTTPSTTKSVKWANTIQSTQV